MLLLLKEEDKTKKKKATIPKSLPKKLLMFGPKEKKCSR
jgi:hypothetical protein